MLPDELFLEPYVESAKLLGGGPNMPSSGGDMSAGASIVWPNGCDFEPYPESEALTTACGTRGRSPARTLRACLGTDGLRAGLYPPHISDGGAVYQ